MKKTILTLVTGIFISGVFLTSCDTPTQNVIDAKDGVKQANSNLAIAKEEYLADIENFKKITDEKVAANEKSIADFKVRIESAKKEAKADYLKKVADIEQKNSDIKKKMDDYKADGKEKWEAFKTEFTREMNDLGDALKNLFLIIV